MRVFHFPISNFPAKRMKAASNSNVLCPEQNPIHYLWNGRDDPITIQRKRGDQMKCLKDGRNSNGIILSSSPILKSFPLSFSLRQELLNIKPEKQYEDHAFLPQGWEKLQYYTATENKACLIQFTVADHSSLLLSQA